ncbi:hypothetical protein GCM10009118_16310 [Wandonia haliotis]|uniref:Secretion system C-terminal sorting domain-containing protein n=1 Tax=Wandonia haliotis TaxID=574963 RepID=A0ABN1MPH0_9FLAO
MKKQVVTLASVFMTALSFGQSYFTEYFNGPDLTSGNVWTVETPVNNGYEWVYEEYQSNGYAKVSNFSSGNHLTESWLISPAIDLTSAMNPMLSFSNTKRFPGDDIELFISTDYAGDVTTATWDNYTAVAGFDADDASWTMVPSNPIDVSAYAGSTIYFAFKYIGGDQDGSTYQIDNVKLEEDLCAGAIFCDRFDGADLTANNNWQVFGSATSGTLTFSWYHNTSSGASNARISNYVNSTQTNLALESWLVSPAIDLSATTTAFLSFDNAKRFAGDDLVVYLSTDYDGTSDPSANGTWTDITASLNMDSDIDSWYFENSGDFNLEDYIGQSTVYLAFKYIGSASDGSTYQIDNVLVSESPLTPVVAIYNIQNTTDPSGNSPYMDQTVTTTGIVTATYQNGYFIQDDEGPWTGIEVFNSANTPSVGDELLITGKVVEFNTVTQINYVTSFNVISQGNALPNPVVLSTDAASVEEYESVLVRFENVVCTQPVNGFGEWVVSDANGSVIVDDKLYAYGGVQGTIYNITGIKSFGFNEHRILPRSASDIEAVLGMTEEQLNAISIYPNPASDVLTVNGAEGANVTVTDAQGKTVYSSTMSNTVETINVENLESGIYFINFEGNKTMKFIVK